MSITLINSMINKDKITNLTKIASTHAKLASNGAKIITYSSEILYNPYDFGFILNAASVIANGVGVISNGASLVTGSIPLARNVDQLIDETMRNILPEQAIVNMESIKKYLGNFEKINKMTGIKVANLINYSDLLTIIMIELSDGIFTKNSVNSNLISYSKIINSMNLAAIIGSKLKDTASELIKNNPTVNYIFDKILSEEIVTTTSKIINPIINYVNNTINTDYLSIITNIAGLIANTNKIQKVISTMSDPVSTTNCAKLISTSALLVTNFDKLLSSVLNIPNQFINDNSILTSNDNDHNLTEEETRNVLLESLVVGYNHPYDNSTITDIDIVLPIVGDN